MQTPRIGRSLLFVALLFGWSSTAPAQSQQPPENSLAARRAAAKKLELAKVSAFIRGRCVDAATGQPLAGCEVRVNAWGGRRDKSVPRELLRPESVKTGVDGRFEARVFAREDFQAGLRITLDGYWPRTGRWYYVLPGKAEDIGTVELHKGVYAVGRVVNETGQPVSKISVGIDDLPLYIGAEKDKDDKRPLGERLQANAASRTREFHLHANKVRYGSTDEKGNFKTRDALPPGTFPLRISGRGLSAVTKTITIPEKGPMEPVTIVVKEEPFMAGVCVDEKGKPVQGVYLMGVLRGSGRSASGRTGRDGRFKIYRVDRAGDRMSLRIMDPGPCERQGPTPEFAWGRHDIKIVMRRALTVEVSVVEAGTGRPVEEFAVRAYPVGGGFSSLQRRLRLSGRHLNGAVRVDGIPRGHGRIQIVPADTKLLPSRIDFFGKEGMAPMRIEVQRLVPMKILVLDGKGRPRGDVKVRVIVPGNFTQGGGRRHLNNPRADSEGAFSTEPNTTFDEEIYVATTDGGGQCIVYGIPGRDDLILGLGPKRYDLQRIGEVAFGPNHLSRKLVYEKKD